MSDNFSNLSDILKDSFVDSKRVHNAFKYSTLFSFWSQIAGKKFENTSKPYSIKNSKLFVSCENSYVVQELLMYKNILLKKILPYSSALGIDVLDIVFDYKNWNVNTQNQIDDGFPEFYKDEKLNSICVDTRDFDVVFKNIDASEYLSDEQKEKFKNRIIKLQKAKKLRFS